MSKNLHLMAFDMGASNGRGIMGEFDGKRMTLTEMHRFENNFTTYNNLSYWDVNNLVSSMKETFSICAEKGVKLDCFGVDTWGVDYGLLGADGRLLDDPRAYRCATDEEMELAWTIVPRKTLFDRTGIANMNFNTVYQLYRRVHDHNPNLARADTLLMMPDLLGYLLTGVKKSEYSNVTTTNLYDVHKHDWDWDTITALNIPMHIFTEIDRAGTLRGQLLPSLCEELGIEPVQYAAVGTHDTASAVVAIPGSGSFAFCSSGTWSLFGVETDKPILTDSVYQSGFSNEGTAQGSYRPLKNIMGLWLIQECRREWQRAGENWSWDEIVKAAETVAPFRSIIDPDFQEFFGAGNMIQKIRRFCNRTGQPVPESVGEIARCIYESLGLKYRWALERLEEIKGQKIDSLNITGGGIQNKLLNRFAADSTGVPVTTGPVEGAALGNLLYQAVAMGELSGIEQARQVVRDSVEVDTYEPHRTAAWDDAYGRLLSYMG